MQTYLFYDIETTGLNKAFDQLLQFAAIRTDLNLQELERYEFQIKLNPDVIPSPQAVLTHQIGINEFQQGLTELEAIQKIHRLLNTPGTISLGYNTLGFDDEFLRFCFFRHLLPPYTHQYANLCSRMDIYPMAVMYYLFKNAIIEWPIRNDKLSLRLEELNHTNQFVTGRSHQAIVDVEATIELAKRFQSDKSMWDFLCGYFNKQKDLQRTVQLSKEPCLFVDGILGSNYSFQCPALLLGHHRHYKNQTVWLRLDHNDFSQLEKQTCLGSTRMSLKKMGEPGFILPLKDNYTQHLSPERLDLALNNLNFLNTNPALLNLITNHYVEYQYPAQPFVDAQASLYLHGFWSNEEMHFCNLFHKVDPAKKSQLTNEVKNPRLRELAIRLLGKYYPDALTPNQKEEFKNYLSGIWVESDEPTATDHKGTKKLTSKMALDEINGLLKTDLGTTQQSLLSDLQNYLGKGLSYAF